ncbi:MAG: rhomboid family intramembrane serine protease [Candidatus Nezhaarchaeota archaeon]|nr:rhomboid family intramembrane serine protease [Candidatus Nezhaarchaeota archaeon]
MGVPVGVSVPVRGRPVATLSIVLLNAAVYVATSFRNSLLQVSDYWVRAGGFAPLLASTPTQWYRVFTSMFLHADLFHIIFNLYTLYLLGRAVEGVLGSPRFLALYLASGIAAALFHTAFSFLGGPEAYAIPAIGASGAISGVLGAFLVFFPGTSLIVGWGFLFFPVFFRVRAAHYLIFWFAIQVIYGYARLGGSVAVFAHAGGFVLGIALLPLIISRGRVAQLRATSSHPLLTYIFYGQARREGLGAGVKAVMAILLASLLAGAAYASIGPPALGEVKLSTVQYVFEGTPYVDYVGFEARGIEDQLANIPLDATRILLSRLYAAGLLYNEAKASRSEYVSEWSTELQVRVGRRVVPVGLTVAHFSGRYDGEGFLSHGEGSLSTQIVYTDALGRVSLSPPVSYSFKLTSQMVSLLYITQRAGLLSIFITAASLAVVTRKDRELTLVGGEGRPWPLGPFTP